ncbi:acetyltransferase [Microbacterium sp.]|uniref:acetyltransferase n=1 Tax=Microbacterium sp. TaxID=51671 RepID=UPI0028AE8BC3|nr:acetyltransferase [Microbacterium sp.]
MTEDLIVVGAGGFGRETLDVVDAVNAASPKAVWRIRGVVDDAPTPIQQARLSARSIPWMGGLEVLQGLVGTCRYVVGIGSPDVRARIVEVVDGWGGRATSLVHPAAVVGSQTSIGSGTVICSGVQLSTNVRLGRHVHLNPGAIVGHDSELGDFTSINPGAIVSGEVQIGTRTLVGAGATVLQGLTIGADALVAASACVTKDVLDATTVVGVPAKEKHW